MSQSICRFRNSPSFALVRSCHVLIAGLLAGSVLFAGTAMAGDSSTRDAATSVGARIYLEGMLPSGQPVRAVNQGSNQVTGTQISCVNCHLRSGLGSSESRFQVPPVTEAALFRREKIGRSAQTLGKLNAMENPIYEESRKPPYTEETLRRAITEGLDPQGRPLNALMPRFQLNREELDQLIAYLRSLSREISPGVTADTLYFATVIAGDVDPGAKKTMLDTMHRFFDLKNANTRNETGRAARAPWNKEPQFTAYRKWELVEWQLAGPPQTWAAQLAARYKKRPVFAMLGGLSNGDWSPVHAFCMERQIPCVLPGITFAGGDDKDFYTVYFSKGTVVEAGAIARHLAEQNTGLTDQPIVQVFSQKTDSHKAAMHLSGLIGKKTPGRLRDIPVENDTRLDPAFWEKLNIQYPGAVYVLWLPAAGLTHAAHLRGAVKIYLSASMQNGATDNLPRGLTDKILIAYPFELPSKREMSRAISWARMKKVDYTDERVLANTYFMLTLVIDSVKHLQTNFYRTYFLEKMEHKVDNAPTSAIYPRVSLAPGQRFVSKGSYIVKIDASHPDGIAPVSEWIIP